MADDEHKATTRREHILRFVPKAARADALRVFAALDSGEPPTLTKSAPPPERICAIAPAAKNS